MTAMALELSAIRVSKEPHTTRSIPHEEWIQSQQIAFFPQRQCRSDAKASEGSRIAKIHRVSGCVERTWVDLLEATIRCGQGVAGRIALLFKSNHCSSLRTGILGESTNKWEKFSTERPNVPRSDHLV